jgi:hypothetical protein
MNISFSGFSFTEALPITNASSLGEQLTSVVAGRFHWWLLTKLPVKSHLHYTHKIRLVIAEHTFCLLHLRYRFP